MAFFMTWITVYPGASTAAPDVQIAPVVGDLDRPTAIANAGDGSGKLFIALQSGKILIYDGQALLPNPFLDIGSMVTAGGERGLLGLAFHPNYAANGLLYVHYTDLNGATVISRYKVSADPNVVDRTSATVLLNIPQPFANHNGGHLQFGPDGFLYIGMGDGGSAGDPLDNAQDLGSLLGKMLRIDVDAGLPYGTPPDNPFVGTSGARPEIWALGLRNPWRFSFDRLTGALFIADVGQDMREEVNFQQAESGGGENYGWRLMEGSLCFNPVTDCNDGSLTLPVIEYDHSSGDCSITGGYRYRGSMYPDLEGIYFYADFCTGRIWGASQDASGAWTSEALLDTDLSISTFGEDEEGELYVAHFSPEDGTIYKITAPAPADAGGGDGGGGGCFISTAAKRQDLRKK
jgi:glucose/arabinose dehydrogenase